MTHFTVNGRETEITTQPDQPIEELMLQVRKQYNSDASVIASIRVNGNELNGEDEVALGGLTVSQIESVEVITAHPRELAEDTLQSLLDFTVHLEQFSRVAAATLERGEDSSEFAKLIDGIQTFTDALVGAKQILKVGRLDPINVLEADLVSILADLEQFRQSGQREFVVDLLRNHLPLNLEDWRREGIPALIRSRDS